MLRALLLPLRLFLAAGLLALLAYVLPWSAALPFGESLDNLFPALQ